MKFLLLAFYLVLSSTTSWSADNLCEALNLVNCEPIHKMTRRSSSKSAPSSGTASQFNPANVSHDRGVGLETFWNPKNNPTFNFVTGTGKAGAALVSSKIENGFFGNRVIEAENEYLERREAVKEYSSDKYTLALGGALFKRRNFGLDLGVLLKYNPDIKRVNPGAGLAMRVGSVSLGASVYQDDVFLDSTATGGESYQEKFTVQTYFAGVQLKNFFIDAGVIKTYYKFYDDDSSISLYSASYIYKKFLFNLALRNENSPRLKYEDGVLVQKEEENSTYGGIQYSLNKYLIIGVHYNYYLLDELAGSLVIFI